MSVNDDKDDVDVDVVGKATGSFDNVEVKSNDLGPSPVVIDVSCLFTTYS